MDSFVRDENCGNNFLNVTPFAEMLHKFADSLDLCLISLDRTANILEVFETRRSRLELTGLLEMLEL